MIENYCGSLNQVPAAVAMHVEVALLVEGERSIGVSKHSRFEGPCSREDGGEEFIVFPYSTISM
jgi:hypothetical protein